MVFLATSQLGALWECLAAVEYSTEEVDLYEPRAALARLRLPALGDFERISVLPTLKRHFS